MQCPYIRGGVPELKVIECYAITMSLHTWGCTAPLPYERYNSMNVPTYVGVYRISTNPLSSPIKCPYIRGGVPGAPSKLLIYRKMSLHTWGCTVKTF